MTYIGGNKPVLKESQEKQERIETQFRDHVALLVAAAVNANQPVTEEAIPQFVRMVATIHKECEAYLTLDR